MDSALCANGGVVVGRLFSPGCIHCKNMEGAWEGLKNVDAIKKAIAAKTLVFFDIDVTDADSKEDKMKRVSNDCGVTLNADNGVPTIYLIKNKRVTYYEGDRTTEAMAKWIANGMGGSMKQALQQQQQQGGRAARRSRMRSRRSRRPLTWARKHTTLRRRPRNIRVFGVKIW
jgi:hypothetical protein